MTNTNCVTTDTLGLGKAHSIKCSLQSQQQGALKGGLQKAAKGLLPDRQARPCCMQGTLEHVTIQALSL
jgi:hypothetical protein